MHSSLIYEIMKVQGQKMIQKRAINKLGTNEIKKSEAFKVDNKV